jgi:uncharacterized LabA/DUF88 family protein
MKKTTQKSSQSEPIVYAFIDSQNLNLGVRSAGWELDFAKFHNYLRTKYHVAKAFLFVGYVPTNRGLYKFLKRSGYILIFKPTLVHKFGNKKQVKGNVDAELVLQAMIEWKNFNKAIIVSGDGDFYCLIEHLNKNNKLAGVIAPNARYSSLIKEFGRYVTKVSDFRKKVERK